MEFESSDFIWKWHQGIPVCKLLNLNSNKITRKRVRHGNVIVRLLSNF